MLGSHVQTTWLLSLTAQVIALALAIAAAVQDDVRSAFYFVLVLELVVSSIQFSWYTVVYTLIFIRGQAGALENMYRCALATGCAPSSPPCAHRPLSPPAPPATQTSTGC